MKWMFVVQNETIIAQNDNLGKVELFIEPLQNISSILCIKCFEVFAIWGRDCKLSHFNILST